VGFLLAANHNTFGGGGAGHANRISENTIMGVRLDGAGTESNTVQNNQIGTDSVGAVNQGNGSHGVGILNGASNNTIGTGNAIAYNGGDGVRVIGGTTTGNKITRNRIYANTGTGIGLISSANGGILAPAISGVSMGPLTVSGTTSSCTSCVIEVFSNPDTGGEGKTFLGSTTFTGTSWNVSVKGIADPYLTATLTHPTNGTSEFSLVFTSSIRSVYLPLIAH
jgi:hypothetical protein